MQTGDLVDDEQQDARDDEGPGGARGCSRKLVTHLDPVARPPATGIAVVDTVHGWDVWSSEEAGENVADESTDTVDGEDVETFVNANEVLVLCLSY